MNKLDKYILKEHLTPFFGALGVLLFILLANFVIKSIDKFLGKGLGIGILLEYLFLNLAWILALAVPMAVLVATLMAFGRLASDNEIVALRSAGVNTWRLMRPALGFSIVIALIMIYFNNEILPHMNHKARSLSADISRKRPDLDFDAGYFIESIPNYTIFINERKGDDFYGVEIFNDIDNNIQRTILANHGTVESIDDGIIMHLDNGEIHENMEKNNEYTKIDFVKYDVVVPIDNLILNRKNLRTRGDREMTYKMISEKVSSLKEKLQKTKNKMDKRLNSEGNLNILKIHSKNLIELQLKNYYNEVTDSLKKFNNKTLLKSFDRKFKNLSRGVANDLRLITSYENSINRYMVELHKKFSIPFACIIFVLVGAPLGIMTRKGNFAISASISLAFFIIYWTFLISGEELADRGIISPFISMWMANAIIGTFGIYLTYLNSKNIKKIKFRTLKTIFKK